LIFEPKPGNILFLIDSQYYPGAHVISTGYDT